MANQLSVENQNVVNAIKRLLVEICMLTMYSLLVGFIAGFLFGMFFLFITQKPVLSGVFGCIFMFLATCCIFLIQVSSLKHKDF